MSDKGVTRIAGAMSDVEVWVAGENSHYKQYFLSEWEGSSDFQKFHFLNRISEIERMAYRYDKLKPFRTNSCFNHNNLNRKDIVIFRISALCLLTAFCATLILINDIRMLISALAILYLCFKFLGFCLFLDECDLGRSRNQINLQNQDEFHDLDQWFKNESPIDISRMQVIYLTEDASLSVYVKTSMRFRYHILLECKSAIRN